MTSVECQNLIEDLQKVLDKQQRQTYNNKNALRKTVFSLCYKLDWITETMSNKEKIEVINNWITEKTKFKKTDLNALNIDELNTLIRQLKGVLNNYGYFDKKTSVVNC